MYLDWVGKLALISLFQVLAGRRWGDFLSGVVKIGWGWYGVKY